MLESEKYRHYAKDCVRIAAGMSGKDRQILLDIAAAWEARATEAEAKATKKRDGRGSPNESGFGPDTGLS